MSLIHTSYYKKTTLISNCSVYRRLCADYRTLWASDILYYKFLCPLTFFLSFGVYLKGGTVARQIVYRVVWGQFRLTVGGWCER